MEMDFASERSIAPKVKDKNMVDKKSDNLKVKNESIIEEQKEKVDGPVSINALKKSILSKEPRISEIKANPQDEEPD